MLRPTLTVEVPRLARGCVMASGVAFMTLECRLTVLRVWGLVSFALAVRYFRSL